MKTLNYSKQRQAIIDFLSSRKDHPTADVIYQNVRVVYPKISLGTVYRNLNLLADMGTIRRVKGINESEHFDADISEHQHFVCTECDCVQDIFIKNAGLLSDLTAAAKYGFNGNITKKDIYFYGLCADCAARKNH